MKKSTTLFWMTVLVVTATTLGKIPEDEERGAEKQSRYRERDEKIQEAEKIDSEPSVDDKTFEDLKAELQEYLDLEKESDEGLGDDIEIMEKDGDDDAEMMENDDVEDDNENEDIAVKKENDETKGMKSDNAEDNDVDKDEVEVVEKEDDEDSRGNIFAIEMEEPPIEKVDEEDEEDSGDVKGQGRRRRLWPLRRRRCKRVVYHRCNCNSWKNAYYRERNKKNRYYRLYLSYLRHYRNYYNKYKAYYRYYHVCNRGRNTCKSKYYRLRQGYKNIVKSHTHLLNTCRYRG